MLVPSHAPLVVAAGLAAAGGWWPQAALFAGLAAGSTLYHRDGERPWTALCWADTLLALAALLSFVAAALRRAQRGEVHHSALCLALGAAAMTAYLACGPPGSPSYEVLHPLWHVIGGAGGVLLFAPDARERVAACSRGLLQAGAGGGCSNSSGGSPPAP
eukprot:tig00000681_g3083.t1